jgi:hypothetical protein
MNRRCGSQFVTCTHAFPNSTIPVSACLLEQLHVIRTIKPLWNAVHVSIRSAKCSFLYPNAVKPRCLVQWKCPKIIASAFSDLVVHCLSEDNKFFLSTPACAERCAWCARSAKWLVSTLIKPFGHISGSVPTPATYSDRLFHCAYWSLHIFSNSAAQQEVRRDLCDVSSVPSLYRALYFARIQNKAPKFQRRPCRPAKLSNT